MELPCKCFYRSSVEEKKNPGSDSNDVVSLYSCDVDSNNYNDYDNLIVIAIIIVIVLGVNGPLMLKYKKNNWQSSSKVLTPVLDCFNIQIPSLFSK